MKPVRASLQDVELPPSDVNRLGQVLNRSLEDLRRRMTNVVREITELTIRENHWRSNRCKLLQLDQNFLVMIAEIY